MKICFLPCALLLAVSPFAAAQSPAPTERLPRITVTAPAATGEDRPIGETGRPAWTSARRFPGARVYIQQEPWQIGVGQWWRFRHKRDGTVSHRLLQEIEIGLPYRMQLDIYGQTEGDDSGDFHYHSTNFEIRFALADWGKLWGNPTLYAEYKVADENWGADVYELKLLLGGNIAPRWHWALNFVWEAETGEEREQETQVTGGLSYSVIESRLGVGVEAKFNRVTARGQRGDPEEIFLIGPSLQWRVTDRLHIDFSCLWGTNDFSPRQEGYVVVGYDFGGPSSRSSEARYTPLSGQGR
jgi:hypothetical protein